MSRPKIKSKVVRSTIANKDVIDLFHGVLGTSEGSVNLSIAHPKYEMIKKQTDRFLRLLEALRDSSVMKKFPDEYVRVARYISAQRDQFDDSFSAPDLAPYVASSAAVEAAAIPMATATVEASAAAVAAAAASKVSAAEAAASAEAAALDAAKAVAQVARAEEGAAKAAAAQIAAEAINKATTAKTIADAAKEAEKDPAVWRRLKVAPAPAVAPQPSGDPYSLVPKDMAVKFLEAFSAVKKCSVVNTAIVTCKNLIPHKKYIRDQSDLKDKFLKGAGMTVSPIEGLSLNVKQIYISDLLSAVDRKFILIVLHKMWTISHDVYEAVSSPDIDVNEFVMVIMSSIGEVRRHIPRCDQAFDKIIQSVDLLKGNFDGYYRDYVASSNPTIIMENFVLDVSKSTNSSPQVTAQFRKIITHYRKLASQQASHPKLQSLFKQVDKNFQELERQNRAADTIDSDSGSGSDDSDEDPDVARHEAEEVAKLEAAAGIVSQPTSKTPIADGPVQQMSKAKKKRMRQKMKAKEKQATATQQQHIEAAAASAENVGDEQETEIDTAESEFLTATEDEVEAAEAAARDTVRAVEEALGNCEEEDGEDKSETEEAEDTAEAETVVDSDTQDSSADDGRDQAVYAEQIAQEQALNDHLGPEPAEQSAIWRGSQLADLLSTFSLVNDITKGAGDDENAEAVDEDADTAEDAEAQPPPTTAQAEDKVHV